MLGLTFGLVAALATVSGFVASYQPSPTGSCHDVSRWPAAGRTWSPSTLASGFGQMRPFHPVAHGPGDSVAVGLTEWV